MNRPEIFNLKRRAELTRGHRRAITAVVLAALFAFPASSSAGLNARATKSDLANFATTITGCESVDLTKTGRILLPRGATRIRYDGDRVGSVIESDDFDGQATTERTAKLTKAKVRKSGRTAVVSIAVRIDPGPACVLNPPTTEQLSFSVSIGASYRMLARYRFKGRMVDFDGRSQRTSVTGNYHALRFIDRMELRTKYRVCAYGIFGSDCWRRSTDDDGFSEFNASLALNDRIGSGRVIWYVDGRAVAYWRYSIGSEGV